MKEVKYILDTRRDGEEYPIKLCFYHKRRQVLMATGIRIKKEQWDDKKEKISNHPRRLALNAILMERLASVNSAINDINPIALKRMSIDKLREVVGAAFDPDGCFDAKRALVSDRMREYADSAKKEGTRELFMQTYRHILRFDDRFELSLSFDDITKDWLNSFESFLCKRGQSANTRYIHLRNLRTIFNDAIDNDVTQNYPFRRFKLKGEETKKRSLSIEDLRALFSLRVSEHEQRYLDAFKLMFFLCGINVIDLCGLEAINNGRVEYRRAKTGRLYSIKVEYEAFEIIDRYRGDSRLLSFAEHRTDYKSFYKQTNKALKLLSEDTDKEHEKPLFPNLTTYWARHTWATIAAELDIPKETISAALGHNLGNRITSIYIDFNQSKVDEANRRVIDYVLYNKR